jgi:hypothetical protein
MKDEVALDWDEAQKFKHRLELVQGPWCAQTRPRTGSGRFAGRSNKRTPRDQRRIEFTNPMRLRSRPSRAGQVADASAGLGEGLEPIRFDASAELG